VADSLLTAADIEPQVFERRQAGRKRRRRVRSERRRQVASSIGIEISPSGVSLAIISSEGTGEYNLITDHVPFAPTSGPYQGHWGTDELSAVLCQLSDKHKLSGQGVSVGLGGEPCVTRAWKGDNEEVDESIQELTERANRYLSLGQGEKVCCYAEKPLDAKRKRAWVTVALREVIDAVATAVDDAGLRLIRLEHSLSALCQAIGYAGHDAQQPVLVVTTGFGRTDLGISYRGQLILDYRPARLDTNSSCDNLVWANAVSKHIKCLRRFLQKELPRGENNLEKICLPGRESVPAELAGALRQEHNLDSFALSIAEFTSDLNVVSQPWEHADMLAAIWLAQSTLQQQPTVAADLMQSLRTVERTSWVDIAKLVWPLAACMLVTAALHVFATWKEAGRIRAERRLETLQPSFQEYEQLKLQLVQNAEIASKVDALSASLPTVNWNDIVKFAGRALPQGTWLQSLTIDESSQASITGASFTNDAIYDYLNRLSESGAFAHVTLLSTRSIRLPSGPAFEFRISAKSINSRLRPDSADEKSVGRVVHNGPENRANLNDRVDNSIESEKPEHRERNG
jgi:hypothetical protein